MPVADHLLGARSEHGWDAAKALAAKLRDDEDPWGDLAHELGDVAAAERRRAAMAGRVDTSEPKALYFLRDQGVDARLSWGTPRKTDVLRGKTWLVVESPWLSRRLGRSEEVAGWIAGLERQGLQFAWPFHRGADCIDAGGEGAHARLFAETAARMARDVWERDRDRAHGILCFSARMAAHLRGTLGVPVVAFEELS
jgi:hypothetical protein